jgi:hypothetical protein
MLVPPQRDAPRACRAGVPVLSCAGAQEAVRMRALQARLRLGLAAGGTEAAFADLARVLTSTLRAIGFFLVAPQTPFRPPAP